MSEFKLQIDRLTDRPEPFVFDAPARWWNERAGGGSGDRPGEGRVDRPFRFEIEASRLSEGVLVEGTLAGSLSIECSRCTRRYAHALRDTFRLVLEPLREDARGGESLHDGIDPEGERALARNGMCLGDDLEAGWFRGPVVFLDDFFTEVVATAMPIQPLCDENCPGLCPHCGMERRGGSERVPGGAACGCEDERVESPFAALAKWKEAQTAASGGMGGRTGASGKSRSGGGRSGSGRQR